MIFHHAGIAVNNIEDAVASLRESFPEMELLSDPVFDENQNVRLILVRYKGLMMELIEGETVKKILKKGQPHYHNCYEVPDVDKTLQEIKDYVLVKAPCPAILFDGRRVVFIYHSVLGLIELLEKG